MKRISGSHRKEDCGSSIEKGSSPGPGVSAAAALIGTTALGYELVLIRIFSITQWHHFAYMILSIAMLGFGSAGTVLALIKHQKKIRLQWVATAFALSMPACYMAAQFIPFETFHLAGDPSQLLYLLSLYLTLALPFFLCSAFITLALQQYPDRIGTIYGFNMIGSAGGALLVTQLLFLISPKAVPALLSIITFPALLWLAPKSGRPWRSGLLILALSGLSLGIPLRVSEYKALSTTLQLPDSRILARARSPMSAITAVSSTYIRETPGQLCGYSMTEQGPLPEQIALFFDADSMTVINRFDGQLKPFAYLDYVTAALPYHLTPRPDVLVVGAGGGTDVLMALYHQAQSVTALEVDPSVFPMINRHFPDFSGGLYSRPDVHPVQTEARHYLTVTPEHYDLIHIALIDSFTASAAGVYALGENYLYTREALQTALKRLSPDGILSITRWIKTPARDNIKLFATAVEALEAEGITDPGAHLLWIRSWNCSTVLLSRSAWNNGQRTAAIDFCEQRGFDLCHAPGLLPEQVNRHTILPDPVYFEAASAILSPHRPDYYRNHLFNIRPATDNSPYFFRFFKWSALRRLLSGMGTEWIPFVEWGYLALLATLLQGTTAAAICILLPLLAFRKEGKPRLPALRSILYFGGTGAAYMFIEIAFIQKIMLFLAYPVYAVGVVMLTFLLFSGLGALWGVKRIATDHSLHRRCMAGLLVSLVLSTLILQLFTPALMALPELTRISIALILPAPLAFFMGVPFPAGLETIGHQNRQHIPWAWGTNCLMAVIAAPLAMLIAMHAGLLPLIGTAAVLYLIIALQFNHLTGQHG